MAVRYDDPDCYRSISAPCYGLRNGLKAAKRHGPITKRCLRGDDVVQFERRRLRGEPLLLRRCTPQPALVERQLERAEQRLDLFAGGDMRHARPCSERILVKIVERGQAPRIELTEYHALGKTVDRPEAEPQRQLLQTFADQTLVARTQHRKAVAHPD